MIMLQHTHTNTYYKLLLSFSDAVHSLIHITFFLFLRSSPSFPHISTISTVPDIEVCAELPFNPSCWCSLLSGCLSVRYCVSRPRLITADRPGSLRNSLVYRSVAAASASQTQFDPLTHNTCSS